MKSELLIGVASVLALASAAAVADPFDDEMNRLATDSGCMLCHSARPARARDDAVLPPAPAWSEIAKKYRGRPDAEDKLVAIVIRGVRPEDRHWAGKTSAVVMPTNRVEIGEEDARRLIRWILR
ncbi:MAG TPA: cytochrome C552 [Burkholderiales bacterium]|nr:cytochrome C552 [Burkholderiales bacterium]